MKLLAKTVEDRYKSAYGLKADLERCLADWQGVGTIAPFVLGRDEVSDRFHMPHKLYGREAEVAALLAAFERVSQGTAELMLVSGFSGIGKSTLVNEMHKPVLQQRGYFVAGKFDQLQRDLPYSALIQALRALVRQLLTEGEDHIAAWRARLLDALGMVGQIIIDVIPEVELIIGAQPPVPQLGLTEAQNRFQLVFQAFMSVFAQKTHPLVIFMDDVQWADTASLHLIRHLITAPHSQYLLMIGAYRDNEVSPTHPLLLTLEAIEKGQGTVSRISLRPLSMPDLNRWLGDTFSAAPEKFESKRFCSDERIHGPCTPVYFCSSFSGDHHW